MSRGDSYIWPPFDPILRKSISAVTYKSCFFFLLTKRKRRTNSLGGKSIARTEPASAGAAGEVNELGSVQTEQSDGAELWLLIGCSIPTFRLGTYFP